jgi:hypothetical protein
MKHLNDTTATIATAVSGGSAIVTFAEVYTPVVNMCVGLLGIIAGILASVYWMKKINQLDGKG